MGWIRPHLNPPTKQKTDRTHSRNQTKQGLEPSPKHGLEPLQPTDPTTKQTVSHLETVGVGVSAWPGLSQRPSAPLTSRTRTDAAPRSRASACRRSSLSSVLLGPGLEACSGNQTEPKLALWSLTRGKPGTKHSLYTPLYNKV